MNNIENQNKKNSINEKSENKKGDKKDFHISFWSMIGFLILLLVACCLIINNTFKIYYKLRDTIILALFGIYLSAIILGIVLRITLSNKNYYLAKGFMWGAIALTTIPFIATTLLFGACLISVI